MESGRDHRDVVLIGTIASTPSMLVHTGIKRAIRARSTAVSSSDNLSGRVYDGRSRMSAVGTVYRFVCNAWPEYKIVDRDRVLAFHQGVLDTDERGAAVIRTHDLFNRRFFESDPDAPIHGAIPEGAVHAPPMFRRWSRIAASATRCLHGSKT